MHDRFLKETTHVVIVPGQFEQLYQVLRENGYRIAGPTILNSTIIYDELSSFSDLPIGWKDKQDAGTYGLTTGDDNAYFGYVVGPQSWKKFLYPSPFCIFESHKDGVGFDVVTEEPDNSPYALIGVRSCDLHALAVLDKILIDGEYTDPLYRGLRENLFIIAVNCKEPGGTCFCESMDTGPRVTTGADLVLTELMDRDNHYFLIEVLSQHGMDMIGDVSHREATGAELNDLEQTMTASQNRMGRSLNADSLHDKLINSYEHPHWEIIAERCLSCGNCTLVCPTCFCMTVEDHLDFSGTRAERWRRWDTCFNIDHSYIHGGSIRNTVKSRYRQWLLHKLATWEDQFGISGCVGCGRCITWCPVGIDITEEARALSETVD